MKMLIEDLKSNNFKQLYLFTGEELYLLKQYKQKLKEALVDADDTMNVSTFEGKGINPKEIIELADTMPFFAERRVIFIEDSGFFKKSCEELAAYLGKIPETTYLIFVEEQIDKRGKLYKEIKAKGKVVEFQKQDEKTLTRWVLGFLKKEEKKITEETLREFFYRTGLDMGNISIELEKLLCYTMGKEVITTEDVKAICVKQVETQIFEMIQAVVDKKQEKALHLYADLLFMKEPPMRILYLITRQFHQLLLLKQLLGEGLEKGELAKKAGIPPFVLGKYIAQSRKFELSQLRQMVEECVKTEEAVKTGEIEDQISVELLLIKYSS